MTNYVISQLCPNSDDGLATIDVRACFSFNTPFERNK